MTQICYYGDKISTNIAMTPEGFLICRNVPIARTGYQQYLGSELFEDGDPSELINVYRSPNEVFSTATIASFEGKPVTDGHPDVDVTPDNYKQFSKGHVQHVRVGRGDDADKILADLYITDQELIDEIRNGKREVSAGYYAEDKEDETGRICQTKIRGNHVAVVDEGRAGHAVAIRDQKNNDSIIGGILKMRKESIARKQMIKDAVIQYLKDAKPEELEKKFRDAAEVLNEVAEKGDIQDEEPEETKEDACKDEIPEEIKQDEDQDVWKAIDELVSRVEALEQHSHQTGEPELPLADEDVDVESEEVISDEDNIDIEGSGDEVDEDDDIEIGGDDDEVIEDEDEIEVIPTDEVEAKLSANDAAIKAISKAALGIKNPEDRKRVQDAIIKATSKGKSQMSGLMKVVKKNQAKKNDEAKVMETDKLQKMYDKLNPHKQ
jgi:hypothetical protein